jgi:hypothetical protein
VRSASVVVGTYTLSRYCPDVVPIVTGLVDPETINVGLLTPSASTE